VYYNLLSSLSSLSSSIARLHSLSGSTSELCEHFTSESDALDGETRASIGAAEEEFERQGRRIRELEQRMKDGSKRVDELGGRLDAVRGQTEACDHRDGEERRRIDRRLKLLWGFLVCLAVLMLGVMVIRQMPKGVGMEVDFAARSKDTVMLSEMLEELNTTGIVRDRSWTKSQADAAREKEKYRTLTKETSNTESDDQRRRSERILRLLEEL